MPLDRPLPLLRARAHDASQTPYFNHDTAHEVVISDDWLSLGSMVPLPSAGASQDAGAASRPGTNQAANTPRYPVRESRTPAQRA